jgi:hypothetical protein
MVRWQVVVRVEDLRDSLSSRVVKKGSVSSILRVWTERGGDDETTAAYPPRYVEDYFVGVHQVAVKLSRGTAGNLFSPSCEKSAESCFIAAL